MSDRKTLERLCKIRRLARDNPSEGEGAAAEKKLSELLARYGLTEVDLDRVDPIRRPDPAYAGAPPPGWAPFPGGVTIVIDPSSPFGRVFGFGFGFDVSFGPETGTSSTSSTWP